MVAKEDCKEGTRHPRTCRSPREKSNTGVEEDWKRTGVNNHAYQPIRRRQTQQGIRTLQHSIESPWTKHEKPVQLPDKLPGSLHNINRNRKTTIRKDDTGADL